MQELQHRKRSDTRDYILDVAEAAILEKGLAGTSIDELIAAVGITKNGFFYHFKDKSELAKALLVRYVEREDTLFDDLFRRADQLDEDPLHGFLIGLKMLSEAMADLPSGHPGCLVAAYCYQDRLFDREVRDLYTSAMLGWRRRFRERLDLIAARYPPRIVVDLDHLADMLSAIAEGGIIVSKVLRQKKALSEQLMLYREFIRAVFLGARRAEHGTSRQSRNRSAPPPSKSDGTTLPHREDSRA
ncbi:TetR/AcrR family transcriptional regulator [Bradyrhizobium sp. AZCC 1719]|uniref:TetR/AcrR family transcriptional regulator n=1 Tax=Bradyrhizobium sp. AZCC 1719 TaxID=3117028 RepID=UPI003FA533C9